MPLNPETLDSTRNAAIGMSPSEAADAIDRFLRGEGDPYDWDDFTSVTTHDPIVEEARLRCVRIRDEFPPTDPGTYCSQAGLAALRELASSLRGAGS